MEGWKEYKLGEILTIKYGKDHKHLADGKFPIYGSGGIMRYGERPIYEGPSILIPRKGSLNNIMYSEKPFWTVDTMFWSIINEEIANPIFLFYSICKKDFASLNVGSAVPSLTVPVIENIDVFLPSKNTQDRFVAVLKSLDDKIEVNRRINENLEAQAQALFKSWFVDFEPFRDGEFVESELGMIPKRWKVSEMQEIVSIKRGGSPRPIQDFLSDKGFRWLKISDATSTNSPYIFDIKEKIKESGITKTVFLKKGSLVLSNSATPGIPKILGVDTCVHDGWLYFPQSNLSKFFLFLLFKSKRDFLLSQGNGSVFTNLKTDIVKTMKIILPPSNILEKFDKVTESLFNKMEVMAMESRRLATLRDTLLPRLMSGELKVNEIEKSL